MTAPSRPFSTPADADIDPDSPLKSSILTKIKGSLIHLEEWIGRDYTAEINHSHDGVNSAPVSGTMSQRDTPLVFEQTGNGIHSATLPTLAANQWMYLTLTGTQVYQIRPGSDVETVYRPAVFTTAGGVIESGWRNVSGGVVSVDSVGNLFNTSGNVTSHFDSVGTYQIWNF